MNYSSELNRIINARNTIRNKMINFGLASSNTPLDIMANTINNINTQNTQIFTPTTSNQTIQSNLYLTGNQTIQGDSNLVARNIANGISIFGVTGIHTDGYEVFSIIQTIYPEGEICTATNGTVTLTASNTSGYYEFEIPIPESLPEQWTLSCTNGEDENLTTTVNVSTKWEIQQIELTNYPNFAEASWSKISEIAQSGEADTCWDLGDRKAIILNGDVGTITLDNFETYVFILDFNHPIGKNTANNNIILSGFQTANGNNLALIDSTNFNNSITNGTKCINMNHWGDNIGNGWKDCDLRYDVLGSTNTAPSGYGAAATASRGYDATSFAISNPLSNTLMAALPSDFRNILRPYTQYFSSSSTCIDYIFLPSEFEVFGSTIAASSDEGNNQNQMGYYAAGNPIVRYRHTSDIIVLWWLSSKSTATTNAFCAVKADGSGEIDKTSSYSYSIAPCFKV